MRPSAVQADSVTAAYKNLLMKRGFIIFASLLTALLAVSCGSVRHASTEPVESSVLDSYAGDYFFREGVKHFTQGHYDAAMDLMSRSLDYDTASAAACYNLAQYYMSLQDRALLEEFNGKAQQLLERPYAWDLTTTGTAVCLPSICCVRAARPMQSSSMRRYPAVSPAVRTC